MHKRVKQTGMGLCGLMIASATVAGQPEPPAITYDSPACQISGVWCVGSSVPQRTDYRDNELLLLYDSNKPDQAAEELMQRYRLSQKRSDELGSIRTKMVTVATNGQNPLDLVDKIKQNERDIDANPSNLFYSAATESPNKQDVGYPLALTGINAAHQFTKGQGVKIGMIDTPIDILHNSLDNSKVQRIELIPAGDARNQKHGTAIAGVLVSKNPRIGIAPEANLYAVSTFSTDPKNPSDRTSTAGLIAKAIDLCIQEKVDILNLSFAGGNDALVNRMVQKAIDSGIIVVASAGNGGPTAEPAYPAAVDSVLAVTAVDEQESVFGRANRGSYIDLSAPGVNIFTTSPAGTFDLASGTSMATAHVSGVVALLLSMRKQGFNQAILEQTAVDLGQRGRDNDYGYGLVNVDRALQALSIPGKTH